MLTIGDAVMVTEENKADWLAKRKATIGASEAATVAGVGWDAPIDLWQRKLGLAPPVEETEPMRWGKLLEPLIMAEYRHRTGRNPVEQLYFVSENHGWMTATVDGMCPDGRIVEVKTASSWAQEWGEEGTDQVPEPYLIQVQHQMAVTGATVADVIVLVGGNRYRSYEVGRNDRLIDALTDREIEFMLCLSRRTPPTWGKRDPAMLAQLFPGCAGTIDLDAQAQMSALHYAALSDEIRRLQADCDQFKVQVLEAMGPHQFGRLPGGQMIKRFRQEMAESTRTVKAHTRHYWKLIKGD